jgi:hypothetical protein
MLIKVDPANPLTWGLDPLFHVPVKLHLSALTRMTQPALPRSHADVQGAVRFHSFGRGLPARPVRFAHTAGTVVHVAQYRNQLRFVLDDASGAVGHFVWFSGGAGEEVLARMRRVVLGAFVAVVGRIEWRHGLAEIVVEHAFFSGDPNAEMLWWLEVVREHRDVYLFDKGNVKPAGGSS